MSDRQIIDQCRNYSKKIELIRRPLLNYTKSKIFGFGNAEDIVQDSLIILFEKMNDFDANKSFHGWAFAICNFQIKKYLTSRKRNKEYCVERFNDSCLGQTNSSVKIITAKEDLKNKLEMVKYFKSKLPPQQLKAFKYIEDGLSRKEARELMKLNESHFNLTYHRAVQSCKKILKKSLKSQVI